MTEEQLSGRALDEACAVAMGWHDFLCLHSGTRVGVPPYANNVDAVDVVPAYSTDPGTQAEKLAWLYERGDFVDISSTATDAWAELFVNVDEPIPKKGSTIDEALARLVVAVAKERSK